MDFEHRLQKAIERGHKRKQHEAHEARRRELTEQEIKSLHTQYRLILSEHIESLIKKLSNHFPGFQYETLYGDKGWGAACKRDDLELSAGKRTNQFSRLEMTIRPYSSVGVLELTAKGTVRNKEIYNRVHFEPVADADPQDFIELIDLWVLEYAELYAAK
ncbi:MAG: hypothetical protein KY475_10325 [Planctomycetes bacterium]|nr:hypothetical protein [Planctomycetota bacterium]